MNLPLKLGIVGSGYIANQVAGHIKNCDFVDVVGVTSRNANHARQLADKFKEAEVFSTINQLLQNQRLDAVYVATPTAVREEICIAAAACGKHILAEKPFKDLTSLLTITRACRDHGVAFMDATHFVHHPRTLQLKRELGQRIGKLHSINASFFFPSERKNNIRFDPTMEPTGAIGDMAWYTIRALMELAGPGANIVSASGYAQHDAQSDAVVRGAGVLLLGNACTSTWDVGYNVGSCAMELKLYGEKGMISLDDFVLDWADNFTPSDNSNKTGFVQRNGIVDPTEFNSVNTPTEQPQIALMLKHFTQLSQDPIGKPAQASAFISEKTQAALDTIWNHLTIIKEQ